MKHYTKEWYNTPKVSYTCGMKKVPDKQYTEEEIRNYYNKALKKSIAEERRFYNEPPHFGIRADELDEETFCSEDWLEVDEETGRYRSGFSFEEAKASLEKKEREARLEYENRPPFDEESAKKEFETIYGYTLKDISNRFPKWVTDLVDKRMLALDLMPESVYKKLREEEKQNQKMLRTLEKKAEKELTKHFLMIPEEIYYIFNYHDACILSIKEKHGDVVMVLRKDGFIDMDETPYDRVIFKEVKRFEREKGLRIRCHMEERGYRSNCHYLNDELYRTEDGGFEYHLMVTTKELRYITIECSAIEREENIEYKEEK